MSITIYDHTQSQVTVKSTNNAGIHTPHQNIDSLPNVNITAGVITTVQAVTTLPNINVTGGFVGVSSVELPTAIVAMYVTVGNTTSTPVPMPSMTMKVGVRVKALSTNTAVVNLGLNTVCATNGYEMVARDENFIAVKDLSSVYIWCTATSNGVSIWAQ